MTSNAKLQFYFFAIFVFNLLYNILPFFFLKKQLLKLASMSLGEGSYIHTPVKFFRINNLHVGDYSTINSHCYLDTRGPITIGSNVNIAHGTRIYTAGHDVDGVEMGDRWRGVEIEDDVFVFSNVLIMPGVRIGKGAVIFPGSVVTKNVAPYTMVGGNPAKYIKDRKKGDYVRRKYGFWFAQ